RGHGGNGKTQRSRATETNGEQADSSPLVPPFLRSSVFYRSFRALRSAACPYRFSLSLAPHQIERRQRDHLRRGEQIVDAAVFIGLMRELELAGSVRDTMRHARHAG